MKYLFLLLLAFFVAVQGVDAQEGNKKKVTFELDTEIKIYEPLNDIKDDGVDLVLNSKEKYGLAQQLAQTNRELVAVTKQLEVLMRIVEKNDGRIDGIFDQIAALEKTAAELRERQAATALALKEAETTQTAQETKITKLESRVVELTNWANDVWNRAQVVYGQSQQALASAQAAEAAARPRGLEKLISWIPGLGH